MKTYYRTNGRAGVPSRFWQWEFFTDQERLAQKDQSLIFGLRPGSFPETMLSHFVGHDFFSVADGADIALCYDLIDRAAAGFGKDQNIAPFRASICSLRAMYGLGPIPGAKNKPETYRGIINDLIRLRLEYAAATDMKSKKEIDRKAAAVAAKCYDVMGDKYFERDEITGLRRGSINMHRLLQHYSSIHKILEDTIEWRKIRLKSRFKIA